MVFDSIELIGGQGGAYPSMLAPILIDSLIVFAGCFPAFCVVTLCAMVKLPFSILFLFLLACILPSASAITPEELNQRFKQLPTVPEEELPELPNQPTSFRGLIEHDGLEGNTWVTFPFVENPGSFGFDPLGRLYVAEANRFWLGVPDLRGANELIRDDFQAVTVEDRLAMYEKYSASFPEGWFSKVADRIIRLEDRDGNGAADHRTLFSDIFKAPEDGIGFSILADDGSVYFTCIPHVWKLTDTDDDGVADKQEKISSGYGVRVSFIGHDLHGITRGPDGMLYFSVGDRGYHVTDANGKVHEGSGRGAIFRCESDGSGLEVYCEGLRNPQELAFDDYGNLFTFDNTGDIGDVARMVYALEGTDSGWDMSHQSPHHYVEHLDWGDFHPEKSMWVAERMFDTWNEEQPQWVYPPASHLANGPSGVTYLTGESLPESLRGKFLLSNYRGPSENCTVLLIGHQAKGAGYNATSIETLIKGVGASDVELGYDGKIYLCDFGGGWSVNENGSVQVIGSKNAAESKAGAEVAALMEEGLAGKGYEELIRLLDHPDRRVRQAAQFALVEDKKKGSVALPGVASANHTLRARLHAIWGTGQLGRRGADVSESLMHLLKDAHPEIRANAARVLGDLRIEKSKDLLIKLLKDESLRVRSLAAIALSRIADQGDAAVTDALFSAIRENGTNTDVVLRHALLTGLYRLATDDTLAAKADSDSKEERLVALLALRRHESPNASAFLNDADPQIVHEAIRAIYDTDAIDSEAGKVLAAFGEKTAALPQTVQRRVIAANYRRGTPENARALLALAANDRLKPVNRRTALIGLKQWTSPVQTDPVHGTFRPISEGNDRSSETLAAAINDDLKKFLTEPHSSSLITLGLELATSIGVPLDPETLLSQIDNKKLSGELRVAVLDSLVQAKPGGLNEVVSRLLSDKEVPVRAAAMSQAFALGLDRISEKAKTAIAKDEFDVARAALAGIAKAEPEAVVALWNERQKKLRNGLWLDAFLHLRAAGHEAATSYASADPNNVYKLSIHGGDSAKGEIVFRNQGACLQCHKVKGNGGVQGPDLSGVGVRLSRSKILEAVVAPGAEITPGYGMTTLVMKSGESVVGRLSNEADDHVIVVGLNNKPQRVERKDIESIAPPVSAMPPVAMALPPQDLRNLVAYLAAQKKKGRKGGSSHGEKSHGDDEKVAK